jgi:spore coat protein CotH
MLLAAALLGCSPPDDPVVAEPHTPIQCSDVFDPDRVFDVRIRIHPDEWAAIEDEFTNWRERKREGLDLKPYHPLARFEADGIRIDDASIRLKGNPCCSWTDEKMQFVIAFDEQDPDGRFKGLRKLALDGPPYDPSMLRERIALSYFEDAGLATSCANSATLSVNGSYYGLYTNVEYVDREFLERQFPGEEPFGTLFKWDYHRSRFTQRNKREFRDESLSAYNAIETIPEMEALVDTEQAYRFWAAETVIGRSDGYHAGSINFFLYHHPERGWQYFPWDLDHAITWYGARRSPFNRFNHHGSAPLIDVLFSTPEGRVQFVHAIDEMLAHQDLDALLDRLDRWSAQIRPHVEREPYRANSMVAFDREVEKIRRRLTRRYRYMRNYDLDGDPRAVTPEPAEDDEVPTPTR